MKNINNNKIVKIIIILNFVWSKECTSMYLVCNVPIICVVNLHEFCMFRLYSMIIYTVYISGIITKPILTNYISLQFTNYKY